jgi:hypothetical protein
MVRRAIAIQKGRRNAARVRSEWFEMLSMGLKVNENGDRTFPFCRNLSDSGNRPRAEGEGELANPANLILWMPTYHVQVNQP